MIPCCYRGQSGPKSSLHGRNDDNITDNKSEDKKTQMNKRNDIHEFLIFGHFLYLGESSPARQAAKWLCDATLKAKRFNFTSAEKYILKER